MSVIQFDHLTESERNLLYRTPALVSYLIGGVDGKFDEKEKEQSFNTVRMYAVDGDPIVFDYYKTVEAVHSEHLNAVLEQYEGISVQERTEAIVAELTALNEILPKVDNLLARSLLKSFKGLAKMVAQASGGVLGFFEITYEEEHLMGLNMITYQP